MIRICHIADVHYRGLSRHQEYREVFNALIDEVREKNIDHIFIGGDLFHTKTTGISPEFIQEFTWLLTAMSQVAQVHMTLGNHDGNLVNMSRQDAITPIVEAMNNPRVHLYKKSGVYNFAPGYNFCVFSLFEEDGWKDVKPVEGEVNIACYHGSVWGARTETDWLLRDGLPVEHFTDYDLVMLGDIHRFQYLGYRDVELEIDENELHLYPDAEIIGS